MQSFLSTAIGSVVRHGISAAAGILTGAWAVKAGITPDMVGNLSSSVEPIIVSSALWGVSLLLSLIQKKAAK